MNQSESPQPARQHRSRRQPEQNSDENVRYVGPLCDPFAERIAVIVEQAMQVCAAKGL